MKKKEENPVRDWRYLLHEIIFEADTRAGKAFDIALLICIFVSVLSVILESVEGIQVKFGPLFFAIEWGFTILFTIEYFLRLICVRKPMLYAVSFYGLVDLLAIIPTYVSIFYAGAQSLLVIRALRLLRMFRVLKLAQFVGEARMLRAAIRASLRKIIIFLGAVITLVLIIGALMHLIEGEDHGFASIPDGIYWTIVTMTTVGYGDLAPQTWLGKALASMVMIIGYGIIAVPTGIVTVEIAGAQKSKSSVSTQACLECSEEGHDTDAKFCKYCGAKL